MTDFQKDAITNVAITEIFMKN